MRCRNLLMLLCLVAAVNGYAQGGGSQCYASATKPDVVSADITWTFNPDGTITIRTTFSKTFVDNTFGTNAIGWGSKGHKLDNLVGSDHLEITLPNKSGATVMEMKLDYISKDKDGTYKTLGIAGGEGKLSSGNAADVVGVKTSLSENYNTFGYPVSENSPPTDNNYTPNGNWIYDVWYEVTVKSSAFGGNANFGIPKIKGVHASPSKTGNNSEDVEPKECKPKKLCLGNLVWNDRNGSGYRDAGEPPLPGITISLYTDNNNDNMPDGPAIRTTVSDAAGYYLFCDLDPGRYIASMPIPTGYGQTPNNLTQAKNGGLPDPNPAGCSPAFTSACPNNDVDNDNNLVRRVGPAGDFTTGTMYTNAITLDYDTEPTNDGDGPNGNLTFDLAVCGNAYLGDFVWKDDNANGIQDPGEAGINDVKVILTFPDGSTAETTTANDPDNPGNKGWYRFISLGPGNYKVTFIAPAGLNPSPHDAGGDDTKDSDPINGTAMATIIVNQNNPTVDAGFNDLKTPPCTTLSLGNMVFFDKNKSGTRDELKYDLGIEGLKVNLYLDWNNDNIPDGPPVATVTTNNEGLYYFSNLVAGRYIVGVEAGGSGYGINPTGNANPNDDVNNDNNGVNLAGTEVRTNAIVLGYGSEPTNDGSDANSNMTLDIGLIEAKAKREAAPAGAPAKAETTLLIEELPGIKVFPNPATDYMLVKVNATKKDRATVRVLDVTGRVVLIKTVTVMPGLNTIGMNEINRLAGGNYQVQVLLTDRNFINPFVIKKK